jgi:hypothetical protein
MVSDWQFMIIWSDPGDSMSEACKAPSAAHIRSSKANVKRRSLERGIPSRRWRDSRRPGQLPRADQPSRGMATDLQTADRRILPRPSGYLNPPRQATGRIARPGLLPVTRGYRRDVPGKRNDEKDDRSCSRQILRPRCAPCWPWTQTTSWPRRARTTSRPQHSGMLRSGARSETVPVLT